MTAMRAEIALMQRSRSIAGSARRSM